MDRSDVLIQAGMTLSSELSLDTVLQRIIELGAEITGARYGALGVLAPDGRHLAAFHTTGVSEEEQREIGDLPVGHGLLGLLIEEARPLRVDRISEHPSSVGFPPKHPRMTSLLGAPIVVRGTVFGDIYLTDKDGGAPFSDEDQEALTILALQAGIAIENARLYEGSARREQLLDAFRQIAVAILSGAGPDEALRLVASTARALVGAELTTIALPISDDRLLVRVADGSRGGDLEGTTFPADGSVSGEVLRTGTSILLDDASADPRTWQPIVRSRDLGPAIFIPLVEAGRTFGTLAVANPRGGEPFSPEDRDRLETFAHQAAVALEFARAQEEIHRLAVLEDRERIARELHDGVIQSLFAVGMGLQALAVMVEDEDLGDRLESAVAEIDRVIRDLRNYIFGLRPGVLGNRKLDEALRALAEEFEQRSGVVTAVEIDAAVATALSDSAPDIVQMAREALSNIGRHAEAATCRLRLAREDGRALLEIEDDGAGFDPATVERGEGLTNLERRAEAIGGSTELDSSPGTGTAVRVLLPLPGG